MVSRHHFHITSKETSGRTGSHHSVQNTSRTTYAGRVLQEYSMLENKFGTRAIRVVLQHAEEYAKRDGRTDTPMACVVMDREEIHCIMGVAVATFNL